MKIRVAGLVVRESRILLVRHHGHSFWILPGGKLEDGETLAGCAERELLEETGVRARAQSLFYIGEFLSGRRPVLDVAFVMRFEEEGTATESDDSIESVRWFPLAGVPEIGPKPLEALLTRHRHDPDALRAAVHHAGAY
ncbi:MAG: NUDIX hydrolase [Planctomycetes bacterium]|nr:NUDIX hydrolase [Planctomycetota bacterium]